MADILATLSSDDDMPELPPMLPMRRARTDPSVTWQPTRRAQRDPLTTWQHSKLMFSDGTADVSSDDDTPVPPPMLPMHRARTEPIVEDIQSGLFDDDYQAERYNRAEAALQSRVGQVTRLQEDLSGQASDASRKAATIPECAIVDEA